MKIWNLDEDLEIATEHTAPLEIQWEDPAEPDPIKVLLANFDWSRVLIT